MITGPLLFDLVPAIVLSDINSTHIFIAHAFVPRIEVGLEDLGYDLLVTTPAGVVLTTREYLRGVGMAI